MLTLVQIRAALADRRLSVVSKVTGIHQNTLREIRKNAECNPTHRILSALSDYLTSSAESVLLNG
jgi:hypothetical protein